MRFSVRLSPFSYGKWEKAFMPLSSDNLVIIFIKINQVK